jgi:hypothetical protein
MKSGREAVSGDGTGTWITKRKPGIAMDYPSTEPAEQ